MGCCVSKPDELVLEVPRSVSTTDACALRQQSFAGGAKLLPFTASAPASYPFQALTRVVAGEGHLFAALWEGVGGAAAARHCADRCYEALVECLAANPDPTWALRQAVRQLDRSFFASDLPDAVRPRRTRTRAAGRPRAGGPSSGAGGGARRGSRAPPPQVKAGVGATGLMVYVDTRANSCTVARLGDALPFLAASKGAFYTTGVSVRPLSSSKAHRLVLSREAGVGSSGGAAPASGEGAATSGCAVGLGFGKTAKLQALWLRQDANAGLRHALPPLPFVSHDCEVRVSSLAAGDETLVLAGAGLLSVMPAEEVGLLLHHFNAGRLADAKAALCAAAGGDGAANATPSGAGAQRRARGSRGGAAGEQPSEVAAAGQLARQTNVARLVMHRALSKALERHNADMEQARRELGAAGEATEPLPAMTHDELAALPLVVDKEALRPPGPRGAGAELRLPRGYADGGFNRGHVHADLGLVVVALKWPMCVPPVRPRGAAPGAVYRWQLLRLAVKFQAAYRRTLRARWWELVNAAEAAAVDAARAAEVRAWREQGSAVKVSLAGAVVDPDTPLRGKAPALAAASPAAARRAGGGATPGSAGARRTPPSRLALAPAGCGPAEHESARRGGRGGGGRGGRRRLAPGAGARPRGAAGSPSPKAPSSKAAGLSLRASRASAEPGISLRSSTQSLAAALAAEGRASPAPEGRGRAGTPGSAGLGLRPGRGGTPGAAKAPPVGGDRRAASPPRAAAAAAGKSISLRKPASHC
ncbi:hypothetical protein HT031_003937 [Scenedesmus sp. PABB004]|nr:hypothetical protein HT031_003937 [Scenedesmus sp. PABB004]